MMMSSKMIFNALFAVTLVLCIFACQKNSEMIDPNAAETNAFVPPTTSARVSNSNPNLAPSPCVNCVTSIIVARRTDTNLERRYDTLFRTPANRSWEAICIDIDRFGNTVGNFFGLTIVPRALATSFTYNYDPINCDTLSALHGRSTGSTGSVSARRVVNEIHKTAPPSCTTSCWLGKVLEFFN
jgi:hypothetical protein